MPGKGGNMKKLHSFLSENEIVFDSVTFGGDFVYHAPVTCPGVFVAFSVRSGGPDNAPEKENVFRAYMSRRRNLEIMGCRTVYASAGSYTVYKVAPVREYAAYDAAAKIEGKYNDSYWKIYHEEGRAAADSFYESRRYIKPGRIRNI